MFRPNKKHKQTGLFGIQNALPSRLKQKLANSQYQFFYETIFVTLKKMISACCIPIKPADRMHR